MSQLTVKSATNETDYRAARQLAIPIFRGSEPESSQKAEEAIHQNLAYPDFQYEWHRMGMLDDQTVSHCSVFPYVLRYGQVEIPFGGIGGVCTHPDHRRKGYAYEVMNDARHYMEQRGDLMAFLGTGVYGFYTPLGYHNILNHNEIQFYTNDAIKVEASLPIRDAAPDDIPQMSALLEQQWAHRVTMIRPLAVWNWRMREAPHQLMKVIEVDGQIEGYILSNRPDGQYGEVVVRTEDAARTIIATLAKLNREAENEKFNWIIAPDSILIKFARRLTRFTVLTEYTNHSGWMAAIINPEGLRDALISEITSISGINQNDLLFDIYTNTILIGLRQQGSPTIELPHSAFLPMMFGSLRPSELNIEPQAVDLLSRLFPSRVTVFAAEDWF